MRVAVALCVLVSLCFLGALVGLAFPLQHVAFQQGSLPVVNVDSGLEYAGIQEAIDAPETFEGHEIHVGAGVFRENVVVNKSVSLVGQDRSSTVIDGFGGTAVSVKASGVEIRDFTVRNGTFGILVDHADNVKIIGNLVSGGSYGIRLYYSRNARVVDNLVREFRFFGIDVDSSGNATLRNNIMEVNRYNFGVDGNSLLDFLNDIDSSNTVDGKPVRYLINQHDLLVDSSTFEDFGYLGFVNSTRIDVEDLYVRDNKQGLLFAFVNDSSIVGVEAVDNWNGVYVTHSENVSVSWCKTNNNFDYGIKFFNSSRSFAISNNADKNGWGGIGLFKSPMSLLDRNEANFNSYNIHVVYTNSSCIMRNNASGLAANKPSSYSIAVYYSHKNLIYRNSFATSLLFVESRNGSLFVPKNTWDSEGEGNYWLNYRGQDGNHDGISDAAYSVGEGNVDNSPLMGRFSDFIVLCGGRLYDIGVVSNSSVFRLDFDSEACNVSVTAVGQNGTLGFCRIAIPNALVHGLENESVGFVFGDLRPTLVANWSDARNHYWYFSYVHVAGPESDDSSVWSFAVAFGVSALLVSGALISFLVLRRRRRHIKAEASV